MSRKYKFNNPEGIYFISFATVYWIDVFIRNTYKNILIDSWKYCQKEKGLDIYGWVIMTSHVHMIIGSKTNKLEDIVRDMKSFTSRMLKEAIKENIQESRREWMLWMMERAGQKNGNNKDFQFWQQHNHPIELTDNQMIDQRLDYIHNNPVIEGIVEKPEDYIYSSARDYCGLKGLIEVEFLY
jgi:REP element-mobilizing transposase RayT